MQLHVLVGQCNQPPMLLTGNLVGWACRFAGWLTQVFSMHPTWLGKDCLCLLGVCGIVLMHHTLRFWTFFGYQHAMSLGGTVLLGGAAIHETPKV